MTDTEKREYQKAQVFFLREIDKLCREVNISYYMIGGTLLGAVRHGGFIPWDGDIDIAMRREDYDRFKAYWAEHPSDMYFYEDFESEKNHWIPHARLKIKGTSVIDRVRRSPYYEPAEQGIFLDIFPLDTPPKSHFLQSVQMWQLKAIRWLIKLKLGLIYQNTSSKKKMMKKIIHGCMFPFSLQGLNRWQDKVMRRHSDSGSGYLVSMASHYSYWKQLMPAEIYGTPIPCTFEKQAFLAPAEIDAYLKKIYGNYMELPPVEKRVFPCLIDHVEYGILERSDDYQRFTEDFQ